MEYWQSGSLVVAGDSDSSYFFDMDGQSVTVRKTCRQQADYHVLELDFESSAPLRFNVSVMVPELCVNACATLNDKLLIGWFGSQIPDSLPPVVTSQCQQHGAPVSTLRPGQVQNISFRWQTGDRLRFYWVLS